MFYSVPIRTWRCCFYCRCTARDWIIKLKFPPRKYTFSHSKTEFRKVKELSEFSFYFKKISLVSILYFHLFANDPYIISSDGHETDCGDEKISLFSNTIEEMQFLLMYIYSKPSFILSFRFIY